MSLANIKGKLSRVEMKNVMAGSSACTVACWPPGGSCWDGFSGICRTISTTTCCFPSQSLSFANEELPWIYYRIVP